MSKEEVLPRDFEIPVIYTDSSQYFVDIED